MLKHLGPISGVATFENKLVATAGYDNQVILWNAADGKALARGLHDHLANQCQFSPCGKYLISASSDCSARLWEIPTMRLCAIYGNHDDDVEMAIFVDDGSRVATCSRDYKIRIFGRNGDLQCVLSGHSADVISIAWDQATRTLLSSSDDGTLRRWDIERGIVLEVVDLDGVETDTVALTDGGVAFAGTDNGDIVRIGRNILRFEAHNAGIKRLVFCRDAQLLVSMSYDRQAAFWAVGTDGNLTPVGRTTIPSIVWPRSCAFLGTKHLVAASFGSTYASFDLMANQWRSEHIASLPGLNAVRIASGAVFTVGDAGIVFKNGKAVAGMGSLCNFLLPFGDVVLTGGQMGALFDAQTGSILYEHRSPLNCGTTFIRNSQEYAVIGTYTGEGLVFRYIGGQIRLVHTLQLDVNAIKGVSASDTQIFAVSANSSVSWHSIEDFRLTARVEKAHDRIVNGCVGLGSNTFVSVSRDRTVKVWRGQTSHTIPSPHRHSIKCVAASGDGRWIGTGSYGGTVAILDMETQEWVQFVRPTAAGISSITTENEAGDFIAASYDGNIYSLSVSEGRTTPLSLTTVGA